MEKAVIYEYALSLRPHINRQWLPMAGKTRTAKDVLLLYGLANNRRKKEMLENYKRIKNQKGSTDNDCEFWLIMSIIDALHDVYNNNQDEYIKAERDDNEIRKLHCFYKQGGIIAAEEVVWQVLDVWRNINEKDGVMQ